MNIWADTVRKTEKITYGSGRLEKDVKNETCESALLEKNYAKLNMWGYTAKKPVINEHLSLHN